MARWSSSPEPVWEAVAQAEAAGWQALFVRGTYGVGLSGSSRVGIRGKRREQGVKDIGGKGHEGGYSRVAWWEGDLEA